MKDKAKVGEQNLGRLARILDTVYGAGAGELCLPLICVEFGKQRTYLPGVPALPMTTKLHAMRQAGTSVADAADALGISRAWAYRLLQRGTWKVRDY